MTSYVHFTDRYILTFVLDIFLVKFLSYTQKLPGSSGLRSGAVGWGTVLQVGRSRIRIPMVSLEFFIDIDCGPGVDSASKRNDYQEYFLGGGG
jgi:hypothetical protein